MAASLKKAALCPIIFGVILILAGLLIPVPGGALTTYKGLDGASADGYTFDDRYSAIDEYVGGDAYNFITGASLVAGKISGTMAEKAVFISAGALCLCAGITMRLLAKKTVPKKSPKPAAMSKPKATIDDFLDS